MGAGVGNQPELLGQQSKTINSESDIVFETWMTPSDQKFELVTNVDTSSQQ